MNEHSDTPDRFYSALGRLPATIADACPQLRPWPMPVSVATGAPAARLPLVEAYSGDFVRMLLAGRLGRQGSHRPPALTEQLPVGPVAGLIVAHLLDTEHPVLRVPAPELTEFTLLRRLGSQGAWAWARHRRPQGG